MTPLLDLSSRVEEATGPDRELAARIAAELDNSDVVEERGWLFAVPRDNPRERYQLGWRVTGGFRFANAAPPMLDYTSSVDAAMTLVPEGWRTAAVSEMEHVSKWMWRLGAAHGHPRYGRAGCEGVAATPALALTAASLRARAAGEAA